MKKTILDYLIDCSTDSEISFVARCEECGKGQSGIRKKFSRAGVCPASIEKMMVYQILYKREWEREKEKMVQSARENFNICPICGRLICDNCFRICDELDMCKRCAGKLEEKEGSK